MYHGDTLYRRSSNGGTSDQAVGWILRKHLFTPVRPSDLVVVEEFSNGEINSETMHGFTTLQPGRYTVVKVDACCGLRSD